jgi:hypothetical protein
MSGIMRLGGWTRIFIVGAFLWTVLVFGVATSGWFTLHRELDSARKENEKNVEEKARLKSRIPPERAKQNAPKSAEDVFDQVAAEFEIAHFGRPNRAPGIERDIRALPLQTLMLWILPPALIFTCGWTIRWVVRWVYRGFFPLKA